MGVTRVTAPRLLLGLMLKRCRHEAKKTQQESARHIGQTKATISKLEEGLATLHQEKLEQLADFYAVEDENRQTLLSLGALSRGRPGHIYYDDLPDAFTRFADLESYAREISNYEPSLVPGLLQIPDYTTALMASSSIAAPDAHRARIQFRRERQQRIRETRKPVNFIVSETAFRSVVGSDDVMADQIESILDTCASCSHFALQILPLSTRDNPVIDDYTIFFFTPPIPTLGYVSPSFGPASYHDEQSVVEEMTQAFARQSELALTVGESRKFLQSRLLQIRGKTQL